MTEQSYRRLVITGASSGIGRALAYEFAAAGSKLVLLSRNIGALSEIKADLDARGAECYVRACDVSQREDVRLGIEYAVKMLGGIDLAILNAGRGDPEWMVDFKSEYIKETFAVNVFGIVHAMEYLIPLMREQGGGVIAGMSSVTDVRGYPGSGSYCATKAAVTTLLEAARTELRPEHIHVATIRPGFVRTALTAKNEFPMPFMISPEKAARIIRRRLEKRRNVISFPFIYWFVSEIVRWIPNWFYTPVAGRVRRKK